MMKIRALLIFSCGLLWPAMSSHADTVDIREWLIPWEKSEPSHVYVDHIGRVWFTSRGGDYIANFSPESGEFNRYDLRKGTGPSALLVDSNRVLWFVSDRRRYIGSLDPGTGRVAEISMPDKKAKDLQALAFDDAGDIWFTVEKSNFIGRLRVANGDVDLIPVPSKKVEPHGIVINSDNEPWSAASGRNVLLRINQYSWSISEFESPNKKSRFREIVTTSDNQVWYADYELGSLGRFNPQTGVFTEWPLPGGKKSRPIGMAVDRNDRVWIIETGDKPSRLIGFDTGTEAFLSETDIPSGGGLVDNMHYYEPAGEIWFGTETNYIGRAKVH